MAEFSEWGKTKKTASMVLSDLGSLNHLPGKEKTFFENSVKDRKTFPNLPKPGPDDWLTEHDEDYQSVKKWKMRFDNIIQDIRQSKKKIYLVPLDDTIRSSCFAIKGDSVFFLDLLREYAQIFFGQMKVEILGQDIVKKKPNFKSRLNEGVKQLLIPDICTFLERVFPKDAYCVVGITMVDLYPRESWNFVFGQAHPRNGIGVFSFARYDPDFGRRCFKTKESGSDNAADTFACLSLEILWRSCKVMVHEICHLFCISHCVYFHCAMNGSNHLEEATQRPMFLCPVCILKLKNSICNISLKTRYCDMANFFEKLEGECFLSAYKWLTKAIENL